MSTQPLVKMVAETELQDEAKQLYQDFKDKKGAVPKWMKVMANCEDILLGFFSMFKATMDDSPLPSALKWKVAKEISDLNKCEFCVSVAEMMLESMGCNDMVCLKEENVSEKEKLAIEYGKQVTVHAYKIDPDLMKQVQASFSDEELVELTAVVGLFNYINRFNDALRVLPD